ncbi:1-phosphofructokinase family hexose kinase [Rhodanobacter sp. OK091]|uniref:1-phosphofructokinase family hexose kinase n=1 Tax=Rhodanobacter sp. OK091 TaxID=1881037 RepID=UPI000923C0D8|nr:1-phosphofructokinase family hexose kinase [Rhodanobacter sp. OK091]SHL64315.1 tagatose 6-phosphate kinase [Rhodanobacter sp. OK091]
MITVIGFNTAIDRFIRLDTLRPGEVSRALDEQAYPGGKGLHVAQTIAALGERVQLVGLVDAAHRNMIGRQMCERGVLFHGIEIADNLRTCIALQDASGHITEILGQGPLLDSAQQEALLRAFRRGVDDSDLVVLSGSLPRGFPPTTYAELATYVRDAGKRCLVDAGGELLQHAVQAQPFLVKPNRDEISELLGRPIGDLAAAVDAVHELRTRGVAMPVVTMGALGAVAADANGVWHAAIELAQIRNTVGSGDCLLAGMTVGMTRNMNLEETLRLGVACGAANAQGQETGFVERRAVEALRSQVRVHRLG